MFRCVTSLLVMVAGCGGVESSTQPAEAGAIGLFRLRAPGDAYDLEQASGLCCGKVGEREGLWVVCDRHGGASSGKIFFYSVETLNKAKQREGVSADAALPIVPPAQGWLDFAGDFHAAGSELLTELRRRIDSAGNVEHDASALDLEGVTIGRRNEGEEARLFVANEEPHSSILELRIARKGDETVAEVVGVYRYAEKSDEFGSDRNDGLEGLAYAGKPGVFYWAEEGTVFHNGPPGPRLFFLDPRLERGRLEKGLAVPEEEIALKLTTNVRSQRQGKMQTLNALTMTPDGHLAAVDRNGGWVLKIDAKSHEAKPWLNLYDLNGVNLRDVLADFPGERRMPYISIEGIAFDRNGDLWLVDDPAMPENFRNSCLVRIKLSNHLP